jgi:pimeloyl-ACP methyl ester carboxylesterase
VTANLNRQEGEKRDGAVESRTADVKGLRLHYLAGGSGPAVVLIHGFAETSHMWRPLIPVLARRFTVVAPDLPAIGDSGIPSDGVGMTKAAESIHALVRSLGIDRARVVGHDIGLMVAYAYACMFPEETEKLVLMEAGLPGVPGFEIAYNGPAWHFRFNGPTPEALVNGRERIYFEHFWNDFAADRNCSVPEADRVLYTEAYARPGRLHASWDYYLAFQQAGRDFAEFSKTKLKMPVLVIGGDKANGNLLSKQAPLIASDATFLMFKDTGHWLLSERPQETTDALLNFL